MSKLKKFLVGASIVVLAFTVSVQSADAAYMHAGLLKQGSRSAQVMSLQQTLNVNGFLVATVGAGSPGMETMYFGPATKRAVMAFQAAKGLTADGIVGLQTGTALAALTGGSVSYPAGCSSTSGYSSTTGQPCSQQANLPAGCSSTSGYSSTTGQPCSQQTSLPAGCSSTSGYSSTTGMKCDGSSNGGTNGGNTSGLSGTVGSLDYSLVSSLNNEEVGEDASNVKIAGLKIDATDSDSDVMITAIKVNFDRGNASTSTDFEDVADEVSVWLGSTKVASINADEFNDDNDFEKNISLSSGAIVRMDHKEDLVIAVSGASNIDTSDLGDTWTADFTQIRFVDAQGATTTENPGTDARTFSFESFATANDVELKASLNNDEDEVNDAHSISVDDSDQTNDVSILAFTLEAAGDSDITVNEIPVRLVTSTSSLSSVASTVYLYHGNNEVGSEDVSSTNTSQTVTFDDLNIDIGAGDEEEFWVKVDLMGSDEFITAGTTIQASVTVDSIDAEDETGEELGSSDLTGSASGDAHGLYEDGIAVTSGSTTATSNEGSTSADDAYGTFTIKFSVTAVGTDVYLDKSFLSTSTLSGSSQAVVLKTTGVDVTNDSSIVLASSDSDASEEDNTFRINEGKTADFTLSLASSTNPDANIRAVLYNLAWDTSDTASPANNYSFDMGVNGSYKTNYVFVQD